MPLDAQGRWIPPLYPKQWEVMHHCISGQKQNIVLLSGPRKSSKTVGCHHITAQHACHVPNANICLLTITQSAGTDSGPWQKLTEQILPEWIQGDFGMEWAKEPYVEGVTKKPKCKIHGVNGGVATLSLESLKNEDEVEARFKGKEYSMIWVNELSKFHKRKTFDTLKQCLRGFPKEHLLFLADTNPCLEEGKESWIYRLWYEARVARNDPEKIKALFPDIDPKLTLPILNRLALFEFTVDDNLSMTEEDKQELLADFVHDKDLVDAYYYGRWVTASADALFFKVFRPIYHVIGEMTTAKNPDPEIMVPEENCSELYTGWDPGDSINSAAVIAEKTYRQDPVLDKDGKPVLDEKGEPKLRDVSVFKYLDELVVVGVDHRIEDFVLEFMEKMNFWEDVIGKVGTTVWHHWSDRSVFERIAPESGRFLHQVIADASIRFMQQGAVKISAPIFLEGAERGPGSVRPRVDLWRRLHFERRIFYSKQKCPRLIEATKGLRKGTSYVQPVQRGSPLKHPWDAASYLASAECVNEMNYQTVENIIATRRKSRLQERESGIVTVGF